MRPHPYGRIATLSNRAAHFITDISQVLLLRLQLMPPANGLVVTDAGAGEDDDDELMR